MPVSFSTLRIRMRRTDQLRFSAESGFWNTICIARLSSVLRAEVLGATVVAVESNGAAAVGRFDPQDRLGKRRLARTGFTDDAERLALGELQIDVDQCRHVDAALLERLGDVGQLEHFGIGLRRGEHADGHVRQSLRPARECDRGDGIA